MAAVLQRDLRVEGQFHAVGGGLGGLDLSFAVGSGGSVALGNLVHIAGPESIFPERVKSAAFAGGRMNMLFPVGLQEVERGSRGLALPHLEAFQSLAGLIEL